MNDKEEEQGSDRFALAAACPAHPCGGHWSLSRWHQGVAESSLNRSPPNVGAAYVVIIHLDP